MSDPFHYDDPLNDAVPAPAPSAMPAAQRYPYLSGLNEVQREAVETLDGPVLVLAGAGTGKTRVLTTRLAHLLMTRRASPFQMLAVTFTNKAAREMRDRVGALIGAPTEGWWMGTFHALAARILRRHAELVGLKSNFTILDSDDQIRLIKQLLKAEGIDDKKWPARAVLSVIERWKDRALTPDKLKREDGGDMAGGKVVELYRVYQERLASLNACDFGDLLLHNITLFQSNPDVLAEYQQRFRYLLVDEYQDTNVAQYLWLRLLAQKHKNICCVGDDDQSIYGWRGAEVGNILRFEADFPGAKIIRLEQNYRSTGHILAAAAGVISNNQGRLGKTLWTQAVQGEPVKVRALWDGEEEARWIGEEIEALQRAKVSLSQIAVLVRAGFQTREFEERFITLGMPYRVIGGPRFYERQEIRDAMAYLRIVVQPDDDLAFERIINTPKRGVGPATIQQLYQLARARGIPLTEATWQLVQTDELKPKMRTTLRNLMTDFDRWRTLAATRPHTEVAQMVLDESGYTDMWKADKTPEAPGRLENLKELVAATGRVREPRRLPGACQPRHGQCRGQRQRDGQRHDAARRQGAGVRLCLPARLGGRPVPQPAVDGRYRHRGAGGGAAAGLCRPDARAPARPCQPRGEPQDAWIVGHLDPVALRFGASRIPHRNGSGGRPVVGAPARVRRLRWGWFWRRSASAGRVHAPAAASGSGTGDRRQRLRGGSAPPAG